MNSKTKIILGISGGVILLAVAVSLIVYFVTKKKALVPKDYQLYGNNVNTNGNTQVQYITYVPEIKQNVFMAVTIDGGGVFLKMVSEDNLQARSVPALKTDVASKLFDPSKWNKGYTVVNGHYNVVKPSDYEIYGPSVAVGSIPVTYVVYDPDATQAVFMAINGALLIMVSADSKQARTTAAASTDTPATLYQYNKWNKGYTAVNQSYLVRKKN